MATASGEMRRTESLRDAGVALAVILGTYALGTFGFPPGYFLVAAADVLQSTWPGAATPNFGTALAVVCAALAVAAVGVASLARARRNAVDERWWAGGVGGAFVALGLLVLGFAVAFLLGANAGPAAIAGVTAAALFAAGWWLLRE